MPFWPSRSALVVAFLVSVLGGCASDRRSQAVTRCQSEHSSQGDPLVALFGSEGVRDLCECTMTAVYAQLPDADQQVKGWLDALDSKLEKRGVLGAIHDTTWLTDRASELGSFATVYARAWSACALKIMSPPAS